MAEATARLWERLDRGEDIHSIEGWVMVTSFNLIKSRFRRRRVERRLLGRLASPETAPGAHEAIHGLDVVHALGTLSVRQQEAVVLRYYLDLEIRDIATAQGVAEGTVKNTLHRAREHLREALDRPPSQVVRGR